MSAPVLKPVVQFLALRFRERERLRKNSDTVPDILHQANAISDAEFEDISHGNLAHDENIALLNMETRWKAQDESGGGATNIELFRR